jgi:hypothetical protein
MPQASEPHASRDSVFQSRLKAGVGGPDLWNLRKETAMHTAKGFSVVGRELASRTDLNGDDGEAVRAMGALLQMAGELGLAASRMLSGREHYAGAALLRQMVEIEYLTWTFKEGHESVTAWLTSTYEERMKVFSPKRLRDNSKGRFLFKDYQDHCEQGGHPVPRGIPLLGGDNVGPAQVLLVDLLTHCWRTWDQVRHWLANLANAQHIGFPKAGVKISHRLNEWGKCDPIYALMVELHPDPAAGRNS